MRKRVVAAWLVTALGAVASDAAERDTRIVDAAKRAEWSGLRELVRQGADVRATHGDGATALHWAAYWDDVATADLLIRRGADVNAVNELGATALWAACENGSAKMVQRLLQGGANPNVALRSGETPLMTAARTGNVDIVKQLLAKGANVNAADREYKQTALMWAVAEQHPAVADVLLAHGADVHARAASWTQTVKMSPEQGSKNVADIIQGGYTPLLFAARVGDLASAKLLVAAGADVNAAAPYGTSPLTLAAHSGHTELAKFLLASGADVNHAGAGYNALHVSIVRKDEPLIEALLAAGADPNAPLKAPSPSRRQSGDVYLSPSFVGATPLWLAARYNLPSVMRSLAKRGADPKFVLRPEYWTQGGGYEDVYVSEGATTVLMAAAGMGHRLFGWDGDPPPDLAREEAMMLESVKAAVELGIDLNVANADGNTALHAASIRGFHSVVKFLIENGANLSARNRRGQTPPEAAASAPRRR